MLKAANLNLARTQLMALRSCFSARLSSSTNPSGENSQLTKEAKTEPKPETVENTQSINQTPTTSKKAHKH